MSSQHRRSKMNHSVVMGPELTERQDQLLRTRKKLSKMTVEELNLWLEVCRANVVYWKNRRSIRNSWEECVIRTEQEIEKRLGNADSCRD